MLNRVDEIPNYEYAVHLSDVNEMCCLFHTTCPPKLWILACCNSKGGIRPIWALDYEAWFVQRLFVDQGQYNIYIEYRHRRQDNLFVHRIQRANGTNECFKYPGKFSSLSHFLVPPYSRDQPFLAIHHDSFRSGPSVTLMPGHRQMFKFIGEDRVCALDKDEILRGQKNQEILWETKVLLGVNNRMDYCPLFDLVLLCGLGNLYIIDASKGTILKEYRYGALGEWPFDKAWWDQLTGNIIVNRHDKTTFSTIRFEKMFPGGWPKHQFDIFDKKVLLPLFQSMLIPSMLPPPIESALTAKDILLSEKKTSDNQSYQCVVCLESNRDCIFLPCLHMCCCKKCSSQMTQCPICRMVIEKIQSVFLS
jgi:hypothetical protein